MLIQTCGLSSQRVYRHLNANLSLHNLSKPLLKKLNLMSASFYAARSHTRLETQKNETMSRSKLSTLARATVLARGELNVGCVAVLTYLLDVACREKGRQIVKGARYHGKVVILEWSTMFTALGIGLRASR